MAAPLPVTPQPPVAPAARPSSLSARLGMSAVGSRNYFSGAAAGRTLRYPDLASFTWWTLARADVPVRLEVSERLDGPFPQPSVNATFFSNVGINPGDRRIIDDEVNPGTALAYPALVQPRYSDGLVDFRGDTLLNLLARQRPTVSIIREGPMTARQALAVMLDQYGVPNVYGNNEADILDALPELLLFTDEFVTPLSLAALMLDVPVEPRDRPSVLDRLDEFFGMFPEYYFRGNNQGLLEVTVPPYGVNQYALEGVPFRNSYSLPLASQGVMLVVSIEPTPRRRYIWTAQGNFPGAVTETLTHADGTTFTWSFDQANVTFTITNDADPDTTWRIFGNIQAVGTSLAPPTLALPDAELAEFQEDELDTDGVLNSLRVTSQTLVFSNEVQLLGPVDWDADYGPSRPLGARDWSDGGSYDKLWPTSSQPVLDSWVPITSDDFIAGVLSVDYALDFAWSVFPADYGFSWSDRRWRKPEGYPGKVKVNGVDQTLPHNGTVQLQVGGPAVRLGLSLTRRRGLMTYTVSGWLQMTLEQRDQLGMAFQSNFPLGAPLGGYDTAFSPNDGDAWIVAPRITVTGYGRGVEKSNEQVSATYSDTSNTAVNGSIRDYGLRHEDIDLGPYSVSAETAMALAASIVQRRALPATRRHLRLAPPYLLRPDDLGRPVLHGDGWQGVLIERRYSEDNSRVGQRDATCDIVIRMPFRPDAAEMFVDTFEDGVYGLATYFDEGGS